MYNNLSKMAHTYLTNPIFVETYSIFRTQNGAKLAFCSIPAFFPPSMAETPS